MGVGSQGDRAHRVLRARDGADGPARGGGGGTRAALMRLFHPVVADAGFDLEDVTVTPVGRRRRLSVVVDADSGVNLDEVAEVSERLSAVLDEGDLMGQGPYVLEVSSPGVDRPLTRPRHWRRAVGRLVRVSPAAGEEVTGRVESADDTAVVVRLDGERRRFGHDELARGMVQVEFDRRGKDNDPDGEWGEWGEPRGH